MNDNELNALAALVNQETALMNSVNNQRVARGQTLAYSEHSENYVRLAEELDRRFTRPPTPKWLQTLRKDAESFGPVISDFSRAYIKSYETKFGKMSGNHFNEAKTILQQPLLAYLDYVELIINGEVK